MKRRIKININNLFIWLLLIGSILQQILAAGNWEIVTTLGEYYWNRHIASAEENIK